MIEKLETLVENSHHFMNKAIFVDLDEFFVLTNKLRASLPEEVRRADRLTRDGDRLIEEAGDEADRVLDDAKAEADKILEQARAQARELASESEIKKLAKTQADEMIERAERRCAEVMEGAEGYAEQILAELQEHISRCNATIENGRAHLSRGRRPARGVKA